MTVSEFIGLVNHSEFDNPCNDPAVNAARDSLSWEDLQIVRSMADACRSLTLVMATTFWRNGQGLEKNERSLEAL